MNFKSLIPSLGSSTEENIEELLGYIEDLKAETEAKLTLVDSTLEIIKEKLGAIEEVNQ